MTLEKKSLLSLTSLLSEELCQSGFDICRPFHTQWYNDYIEEEGLVQTGRLKKLCVNTLGRRSVTEDPFPHNAILIGNTKYLWEKFIPWCRDRYVANGKTTTARCLEDDHPFDTFTTSTIEKIVADHMSRDGIDYKADIFFSHVTAKQDIMISMQRVAHVSGLCYLDQEATNLCIHPVYGTWTAFRAVVVFHRVEVDSEIGKAPLNLCDLCSPPPRPNPLPCLVTPAEKRLAKQAMEEALARSEAYDLCEQLHKTVNTDDSVMGAWIALRDCVSLGKDRYRYTSNQLWYHYTKDVKYILNELEFI